MAIWQRRGSAGDGAPDPSSTPDPAGGPDTSSDQGGSSARAAQEPPPLVASRSRLRRRTTPAGAAPSPEAGTVLDERPTGVGDEPPDITPAITRQPRRGLRDAAPVTLFRAAHPKQGLVTAAALMIAAAFSGRDSREVLVVFVTVLVGQSVLGWHNDVVDRERDARHHAAGKPVAEGRLDPETVWYAVVLGLLLLVPLSLSTGVTGGLYYLVSVVVGLLGNVALRTARFSFLPWAAAFAMYPFYLSYGGWGGAAKVAPPQPAMVLLAALLGVGVHVVRSLWGLLADDAEGWTYPPLRLARRVGTDRLLVLGLVWCAAMVALMAVVGGTTGLRQ